MLQDLGIIGFNLLIVKQDWTWFLLVLTLDVILDLWVLSSCLSKDAVFGLVLTDDAGLGCWF